MIATLLMMLVAVVGTAPQASLKDDQGCAYFPGRIGVFVEEGFTTVDIREVLDGYGRTIGVVYVSQDGRYIIQGNRLLGDAELHRFKLERDGGIPFTTFQHVDIHAIHHRVVECQRNHIMKVTASEFLIEDLARRAYRMGRSHIPDVRVDSYPSN